MTSQSGSSPITNPVRPGNVPLRRTHVQFCPPTSPSFSWTDQLYMAALPDDEIQHLLIECSAACSVLRWELNRREGRELRDQNLKDRKRLFTAFQNIDERPLQPTTTEPKVTTHPTNWLLARLTGFVFPWENKDRLLYYDQACVIQLGFSLTTYPIIDEKYQTSSLLPADDVQWAPLEKQKLCGLDDFPLIAEEAASLVYFAGNNVPESFLSTKIVSWSTEGKVVGEYLKVSPSFEALMRSRFLIHTKQDNREKYTICASLARRFKDLPKRQRQRRSLLSLKHVCFIFPKDGQMEPLAYTKKGYALVPILRGLMQHLWTDEDSWDQSTLYAAFEALLSATQFGDLKWKLQALRAAEELALLTTDCINLARISFRHWTLKRLHPVPFAANRGPAFSLPPIDRITATDQRANAFLGQRALIEAQDLIDKSASPTDVLHTIQSFRSLSEKASFQEELVFLEGNFLYAKSLRYNGRFDAAFESLREVLNQADQLRSRLVFKISLHLAEVESERGNHSKALRELEDDKKIVGSLQQLELGTGRRLTLALANVRLLRAVKILDSTQCLDHETVLEADKLFTWLRDTYAGLGQVGLLTKQSAFHACCGLAMIHHIRREHTIAYDLWNEAKAAAKSCWPEPGFAFMVATYSQSQLAFHLGRSDADFLLQQARKIWSNIEKRRCYYFVGLGTQWLDLMEKWMSPDKRLDHVHG
ncbi:hypothetical protein Landi51_13791 [Colletotrichum acutatum]